MVLKMMINNFLLTMMQGEKWFILIFILAQNMVVYIFYYMLR